MVDYIIVSACLIGVNCNYRGGNSYCAQAKAIYDEGRAILICPEILGGLPTPRFPSEIVGKKVLNNQGEDKTNEFQLGADKALAIAKEYSVKKAILKANSPSCGVHKIYDGTFKNVLVAGTGITARLLQENGIEILDEEDLEACKDEI